MAVPAEAEGEAEAEPLSEAAITLSGMLHIADPLGCLHPRRTRLERLARADVHAARGVREGRGGV